jgi:uncharacterized DUF497 family protein
VKIEYDEGKSNKNARERGLPFETANEFDWPNAIYEEDVRKKYPERRFVAVGCIGEKMHVICFTPIEGGVRIISLRKANRREVRAYEAETADR